MLIIPILGLLWELDELIYTKCLEYYLAHNKFYVLLFLLLVMCGNVSRKIDCQADFGKSSIKIA